MDTWSGHGEGVGPQYIPRLCVTEEYIPLYLSVRRSRGIYGHIFIGIIFLGWFIG
jgi:hypothetical protein